MTTASQNNPAKKTARKARAITSRGGATKDRILDAAEQLFADNGFNGTSMRDIANLAPAELSSMSYHFKSKDEIFNIVLERRAIGTCAAQEVALDAVVHEYGEQIPLEAILTAYAESALRPIASRNRGWLNYSKLVMQRLTIESSGYLHPSIRSHYLPVRRRYIDALSRALPGVPAKEVEWCFAVFESSFGSMLFGYANIDKKQKLAAGAQLAQLRKNLIPYCAAGFRAVEAMSAPKKFRAGTTKTPIRA